MRKRKPKVSRADPSDAPPAVAMTCRELAAALGKSHVSVWRWLRHPAWPFGRRGPWSVDAVRAWATCCLQMDRAQYAGMARAAGGTQRLADLPLPVQVELNVKIKKAQMLDLRRQRLEGKLHDGQACRQRRLREIQAAKGRLLDLGRSLAPALEGKDRAAIKTILGERLTAIADAFAAEDDLPPT